MTVSAPRRPPATPPLRERMRLRRSLRSTPAAGYDAFISYSHADAGFVTRLQRSLERLTKPWFRSRAVRVFRDVSSLAPSAELWTAIQAQLQRSSWFVLAASPEAAASPWVDRELRWWLERHGPERLLIVITDGEIAWDDVTGDFTPASGAAPPALRGRFAAQPGWIEAAWSRSAGVDDAMVKDVAAGLLSAIRAVPKDEILTEAIRQHQRTMRLAAAAMASLALLLVVAIVAGLVAFDQRNSARTQATLAESRQLAGVSNAQLTSNLDVAMLFAAEAVARDDNAQTRAALTTAALASPRLARYASLPARVTAVAGAADGGTIVAGLADGRVMRWRTSGSPPVEVAKLPGEVTQVAVDAAGRTVVATDGTILSEQARALLIRDAARPIALAVPEGQKPAAVGISPSGRTVLVYGDPPVSDGARSAGVFDGRSGTRRALHDLSQVTVTAPDFIVPSDDEVVLYDAAYGAWDRRALATWKRIDRGGVGFGTAQASGVPSADGEYMTATNGTSPIPIWNMHGNPSNPRPDRVATVPISGLGALALSPDASRLAIVSGGAVLVATTTAPGDSEPSAPIRLAANGNVDAVRFLGGDDRLLSVSGTRIATWDLRQIDRLARALTVPAALACNACSGARVTVAPGGRYAAIVGGSADTSSVVDLRTGAVRRLPDSGLDFGYQPGLWRDATHVAFPVVPPAGGREATAPQDLPTGVSAWRAGEDATAVVAVGTAANGRDGVVVDQRGDVSVHELASGTVRRRITVHPELAIGDDAITAAAVTGERVVTLLDHRVSVVDLGDGRVLERFDAPGTTSLAAAGDRLFLQKDDGTLDVRGGPEARLERTLAGDPGYVWPPVVNPQGTLVARQRRDGVIAIVEVATGETLVALPPNPGADGVKIGAAFTPDGARLITVTDETTYQAGGTLVVRDLSTAALRRSVCEAAGRRLTEQEWQRYAGLPAPERPACG